VTGNPEASKTVPGNKDASETGFSMFLERHPWISFAFVLVCVLPEILYSSQLKLLWHDELFTYYIAKAPTLSTLIFQTQTLDLNPPLYYLLVRGLFYVLPNTPTVCRIPSMAGFVLSMGCLYSWTRKRFGVPWGVVGVLVLATCADIQYSLEARPYGLVLGFVSLAFVGWQSATDQRGKLLPGLVLVVVGGFGALLSHVFAIFAWMALVLAEGVRIRIRREFSWPVVIALLFPFLATAMYVPLIRTHAASYYPAAFQASIFGLGPYYIGLLGSPLMSLIWVVILTGLFVEKPVIQPGDQLPLTNAELTALLGLFFVPAILILYLANAHGAFFERYGMVSNIAVAALLSSAGGWLTRGRSAVAWLAALVLFVASPLPGGMILLSAHPGMLSLSFQHQPVCQACELVKRVSSTLPLVDASGLTYLEMDSREDSEFLTRVYYLTDPVASIRYAHANIFEGMAREKEVFPIRANIQGYESFVQQHSNFLVFGTYDYPEDWLLRKLQADGAHLSLLGTVDDPQFKDSQLWRVELDVHAGQK